jgi:hypothetical protein
MSYRLDHHICIRKSFAVHKLKFECQKMEVIYILYFDLEFYFVLKINATFYSKLLNTK